MSNSGFKAAGSGTPQLTVRAVLLAIVLGLNGLAYAVREWSVKRYG